MSADTGLRTFEEAVGPLISRGFALAVTMLNDRMTAEDALQEAYIKAWKKLPSLRDRSAIEPWFLSIVANQCRSIRRNRWWSVLKVPDLRRKELREDSRVDALDLEHALDKLNREERLVLLLHFYMDMTFEQVGRVVGISMSAARARTYRALDRLRADMQLKEALDHGQG